MRKSTLNKLVRNEIRTNLFMAKYGFVPKRYTDSTTGLSKSYKNRIRKIAQQAIRIHDKKYNDFIATAAFASTFALKLLPILIFILKSAVIGGITGAVSSSVKQKVVDPLVTRIINRGKQLIQNKNEKTTYTQAIIGGIKQDMESLINVLKKEKAYIAPKLLGIFNKIKGLVK